MPIEGSIPADPARLANILRVDVGWFKGGWPLVRKCFNQSESDEGRLVHPRLEEERQKQRLWSEKCGKGGIHSGKSRRYNANYPSKGSSRVVELKGNSSSSSSNNNTYRDDSIERAHF